MLFKLTQKDIYFGTRRITFMLVNDYSVGTDYYLIPQRSAGSMGEIMLAIDEAFGNGDWQNIFGLFYNPDITNHLNSITALRELYPLVKSLPELFTVNTTLYSNAQINQSTSTYFGSIEFSSVVMRNYNLASGPLGGTVVLTEYSANEYTFTLELPAIYPYQINTETGRFTFTTGQKYPKVRIWVRYYRGSLSFEVQILSRTNTIRDADVGVFNGINADEYIPSTDPYQDDEDESDGGGGEGGGTGDGDNYTDDSEDNDVPDLPGLSAVDTGFITLYAPTISQLKALANYLWGDIFDITTWKKVMADPMDAIIGLSIVPVTVPVSGSHPITVGNISTGLSANKASTQYLEVVCGTITIEEYWKAYLDYSPYTKISIYLPFIGSQELDTDLIQAGTLGVTYHIDILSGACVAFITANGNVIAQFSGQCAVSIPITSQDFTQTIMSLGQLVASGIGVVATGGMSAPVQGAAIAGLATAAANTAANVISSKPTFAKSGNMAGSNGLMGVQTPYIIIQKPKLCVPDRQNSFTGYPGYVTRKIGNLVGFTQMQDVHLKGISCTDSERDEILSLLRSGVIV